MSAVRGTMAHVMTVDAPSVTATPASADSAATPVGAAAEPRPSGSALRDWPWLPPLLASVASALAFYYVRPDVGDLQAALARQSAAAHGVGLTYWFQWFGGGTTPGHYSVITPLLSSWLSAPLVGALATIAVTPLVHRVLAGTRFQVAGTWVGTITAGCSLWSGRIAFALGAAAVLLALIGLRERRVLPAVLGTVAAVFASPVTGV